MNAYAPPIFSFLCHPETQLWEEHHLPLGVTLLTSAFLSLQGYAQRLMSFRLASTVVPGGLSPR